MGFLEDKIAQLTEAAKTEFKPQAIESLKNDVQALHDKADSLEFEAANARSKAGDIQSEIDAENNPEVQEGVASEGEATTEPSSDQPQG